MNIKLLVYAVLFTWLVFQAKAADFYISPVGNDKNPGTFKLPFATFERAKKEIVKVGGKEAITVYLRGGTYYLPQTLVFTTQHSGALGKAVTFSAYKNEVPVVSGGEHLRLQWSAYKQGIFKAKVPAGLQSDQLFVNGKRQHMARYPNFDLKAQYYNGFAADAFSKERSVGWNDPAGGYIHAMHKAMWGDYHYLITGKDSWGNVAYTGGWQNNRQMGMDPERRYVENIFEELDAPGEWYLDRQKNELYFYPEKGLELKTALIEAVRLKHLVELNGDEQHPVKFLEFIGITFKHSARSFMENKEPLLRSDWTIYRGGMFLINGAEDCGITNCILDQAGGNAIFVNNYNRRIKITGCHIDKAGSSGVVFVGDPKAVRNPLFEYNQVQELSTMDKEAGPKTANYPANCLVEDCLIHESGRVEKQTAGVQIEMAQQITVRHCSIYEVPRAGINIGSGAWGGHLIEWNDVFNTVMETGDHGSFNSWGRDRFWRPNRKEVDSWVKERPELPFMEAVKTVIIRNNRWRCDHGWDIDLDDGSTNYLIQNNLCLNGGLKNREGYNRVVENNIMVNNSFHPHVWYQNSNDIFKRNIVFTTYKPIGMPKVWGKQIDSNFYHYTGGMPATAVELQQQSSQDQHSLMGNALFIDAEKGDYRVKENSPALKTGFRNFPMTGFGVVSPALRKLARTPELPKPVPQAKTSGRSSAIYAWLGSSVRNILGQGEMSAYGLAGEVGVLVLDVPHGSPLVKSGILKDDVIVSVNSKAVKDAGGLLKVPVPQNGVYKVEVIRDQKSVFFEVKP